MAVPRVPARVLAVAAGAAVAGGAVAVGGRAGAAARAWDDLVYEAASKTPVEAADGPSFEEEAVAAGAAVAAAHAPPGAVAA